MIDANSHDGFKHSLIRYVEQLLIARNRHSFCVAQVTRGKQRYLTANAIIFGQPVARMYEMLPPPRIDIEQCLAILFVGSAKPTNVDISRTPFIVRHAVVLRALEWLKRRVHILFCKTVGLSISPPEFCKTLG